MLPLYMPDTPPVREFLPLPPYLAMVHAMTLDLQKSFATARAHGLMKAIGWTPKMPVLCRSQFGEDVYLWRLLGHKLSGVFVEVGAHDGSELSVSYFFESIGWRGHLVEANAELAAKAATSRPGCSVYNTIACDKDGSEELLRIPDGEPLLACTMKHEQADQPKDATLVSVATRTLDSILASEPAPIDFMVIDIEGSEVEALRGMKQVRPRVLMIEDSEPVDKSPIIPLVGEMGYVYVAMLWCNRVFIRTDETELIARAVEMQRA